VGRQARLPRAGTASGMYPTNSIVADFTLLLLVAAGFIPRKDNKQTKVFNYRFNFSSVRRCNYSL